MEFVLFHVALFPDFEWITMKGPVTEGHVNLAIYKELFENAAEGLIVTDRTGNISLVNPRAEEMFGYPNGEMNGLSIEALIPPEFRKKHAGHRENYQKQPKSRSMGLGMELYGIRKDESIFPVEVSLNQFSSESGKMVMALITDITERKKSDEKIRRLNEELEDRVNQRTRELRETQKLYVAIARNFPDGTISVFDRHLHYVFFEGKQLYKAGIDSSQLIGTALEERLPEEHKTEVIDLLKRVFNGEAQIIEFQSGDQTFEINAVPLGDKHDKINQILVVERNISAQKQAEADVLGALEQERQLNELKSRFVSMASHEFRTPLSTILSSISLVSKYNESMGHEKIAKHVTRIKSSVQNLNGILHDFLSIDKLEEGKIAIHPTRISIADLAHDIIEEMEAILKPGQVIDPDIQGEDKPVTLDGQLIKNILINLVSNAIKYSGEGQRIALIIDQTASVLKIQVRDEGIGIAKTEQVHLFERFFRAQNALNIEGTGLGLHIVKKYVDLMDGTIAFESEEGKGTAIFVTIPLTPET